MPNQQRVKDAFAKQNAQETGAEADFLTNAGFKTPAERAKALEELRAHPEYKKMIGEEQYTSEDAKAIDKSSPYYQDPAESLSAKKLSDKPGTSAKEKLSDDEELKKKMQNMPGWEVQ